jgi:hypothetical protein
MIVNNLIALQIIRSLVTPFTETDAFKQGVINEKGDLLVKSSSMSVEQKKAYGLYERLIFKVKRIIERVGPGRLASYAAAFYLIKESITKKEDNIESLEELINNNEVFVLELFELIDGLVTIREDIATNNTGNLGNNFDNVFKRHKKIKNLLKRYYSEQ